MALQYSGTPTAIVTYPGQTAGLAHDGTYSSHKQTTNYPAPLVAFPGQLRAYNTAAVIGL